MKYPGIDYNAKHMIIAADLFRARSKKRLLTGLLLPIIILLASCSQEAPPVEQRLIILGFDGMDPVLTRQWMDDGSLPNFRKLAAMGGFHSLPMTLSTCG